MTGELLVQAATLQHAFSEVALRVFALATTGAVQPLELREVRAHGPSLDALLSQWIGECTYVLEIEGFVCCAIDFVVFDVQPKAGAEPMRLHAFLRGQEVETAHPVKVAPSEERPIRVVQGGYEIHLSMDD